ncbi:MAG: metallophosphoesterase [Candidatus Nanopelagicales bacterium]|nr:metallophosphoesterase [Candidatus Nanopelagicales bacterium]
MTRVKRLATVAAAVGLLLGGGVGAATAGTAPDHGVIAAYALAAPTTEVPSGLVARAVVPAGSSCPALEISARTSSRATHRSFAMTQRLAPATTGAAFASILVCSAPVPVGASTASVGGHVIPAHMPARVQRLAMFGDTGCRIESTQVQDCADSSQWPLARLARSMATQDPDAIVFNGDFFYREAPCPALDDDECGSSPPPVASLPITDSAYGWIADVLLPMAPVLPTAPLIVTRGNHEACYRAGNGYFLMFDPREGTEGTCAPVLGAKGLEAAATLPLPTYAIDLPVTASRTLRLAIVDSAGGSDTEVTSYAAQQRPAYEQASRLAAPAAGRESWLVTHRPLYAYVSSTFAKPGKAFDPWTSRDQAAAAYGLLGNFALVSSSHIHIAQAVQLPGLPGQLVLGNGGTLLDPAVGYALPTTGQVVGTGQAYPVPSSAWVDQRFGYAMAYPNAKAGSWRMAMLDHTGRQYARCGVDDRRIFCANTGR